jgi:hypothetical protein
MKELWKIAIIKAKAAGILLMQIDNVKTKIELFGRQLLVNKTKRSEEADEVQ